MIEVGRDLFLMITEPGLRICIFYRHLNKTLPDGRVLFFDANEYIRQYKKCKIPVLLPFGKQLIF